MAPSELVSRPTYERTLIELLGNPAIKVLTGVRRSGKSTLLELLKKHVVAKGLDARNVLTIRVDSPEVPLEVDAHWLNSAIETFLAATSGEPQRLLLVDEIQDIEGWEKVIRRFCNVNNLDIYLTGSNAYMLSSDLATYLSGRYIEIPIFPLSFQEFCAFQALQGGRAYTTDELFAHYLTYGGMPIVALTPMEQIGAIQRELAAIKDTVLLYDVAKRIGARDITLLETLVRYLASTSGNLFSTRKVAGALTSAGKKTYISTVETYITALQKANLLYGCEQVGLRGKQVLNPLRKFYLCDTGLRNQETGFSPADTGFQLENVVYIELLRRGYTVYVGALKTAEIDFVAERSNQRLYIQVCASMLDEKTTALELAPLEALTDAHPRVVLTLDRVGLGRLSNGIELINLIDWLLDS